MTCLKPNKENTQMFYLFSSNCVIKSVLTHDLTQVHLSDLIHAVNQGCDRYKYFASLNPIQNQIRLVLFVLTDTKIQYHYRKMVNFVSPNQIQIQIGLVLLVRPDTRDTMSQP